MIAIRRRHTARVALVLLALLLLVLATTAEAQSAPRQAAIPAPKQSAEQAARPRPRVLPGEASSRPRQAMMPEPARAETRVPGQPPLLMLRDGTVLIDLGRGYERVIRSCDAYLLPARDERPARGAGSSTSSSLKPLHDGWRTLGTLYYEGACYLTDRHGRLHLIRP